jgi:integrase
MRADIVAGKTAKPRSGRGGIATGGPGAAARTLGMMVTILEYARKSLKVITENPARGVTKPADRKQRRFLSLVEIAELGQSLRETEVAGHSAVPLAAIRLLLLTGLRRMEALALRRAWVDSRVRCIRFVDTKSGPQIRPRGAEAVKLIEAQRQRDGSPWVFPWIVFAPRLV